MELFGFEIKRKKKSKNALIPGTKHYFNEVEAIYKAHTTFQNSVSVAATLLAIFIAIAGFLGYTSIQDMVSDLESQKKSITEQVRREITDSLENVKSRIREKIEMEFNQGNIRQMITEVAETKVIDQAGDIIQEKLENKIEPEINRTRLELIYLKARNDSRGDLNNLKEISEDKTHPLNTNAKIFYDAVIKNYSTKVMFWLALNPDIQNENLDSLSLKDYKNLFLTADKNTKIALISELWFNKKIDEKEKIKLFIKVIEVDESIEVTRSVASVLINNLKLNCGIMEWDKVIELAKKKL